MPDIAQLRRSATVKALRTRRELGVPTDAPIDIYDAIRRFRLWLLFQPLDGVLGMYQRTEDAAGVVVNVKVQPSLQRFTAAHELGHHVMGHEAAVDPERNIQRWSQLAEREISAQLFAAEFLMPLAAVNAAAAALGIDRNRLNEIDVYQLSLWLRTSYLAMVVRLQTMGWIDVTQAHELRAIQPHHIKRRLLGHALEDARADVWLLNAQQHGRTVAPLTGDELRIDLAEVPSSGYRWQANLPFGLVVENDAFTPPPRGQDGLRVGGQGNRSFHIAVTAPSAARLRLHLSRPWQPVEVVEAVEAVEIEVQAASRPEAGVDPTQQPALLAS